MIATPKQLSARSRPSSKHFHTEWSSPTSTTGRYTIISCAISLFFFQAEDGIRDPLVTGVQTCALPILLGIAAGAGAWLTIQHKVLPVKAAVPKAATRAAIAPPTGAKPVAEIAPEALKRSEERRVGKECRCGWSADQYKRK